MNKLGLFLKQKRLQRRLSQRDVSDFMGYSTPQFISNLERGRANLPMNQLKKFQQVLGVDSKELCEKYIEHLEEIFQKKVDFAKKRLGLKKPR